MTYVTVYLALGSNVGDREGYIRSAVGLIDRPPATRVVRVSAMYETRPYGVTDQPMFINAAAEVSTTLEPVELLALCKEAEVASGRVSRFRWGPREVDVDIIFYGDSVVDLPGLHVPHQDMHKRLFVLEPMCEIAPDFTHPVLKKTVREMMTEIRNSTE